MTPDRTKNVNDTFSLVHEHEKCIKVRDTGFVQTAITSCRNRYGHSAESVENEMESYVRIGGGV